MTTLTRHIRSLALAGAGLFASVGAFAQGTWDLDACARAVTGACTSGGSTVSISGYYSNGASSSFLLGTLNVGTDWAGVRSGSEGTGSPHHAIDSYSGSSGASYGELAYLSFNKAVDLSQIAAVWVYDDPNTSTGTVNHGEFQLWRWNNGTAAPGAITGFNAAGLAGAGWTAVTAADFGVSLTQSVNDGTYYSSHWLISTKFGGGNNDAFKLGTAKAAGVCAYTVSGGGLCTPPPNQTVPEPFSLALFGIAAFGATIARRRAAAKRA